MIGKNLKMLREVKNKSQQEVCNDLNIEQSTLANYENDKRVPKIDILIKIAKYYKVSVDYLLGIEKSGGNNYSNFQLFEESFDFRERVRSLMNEQNMSEEEFMNKTGFDKTEKDDYLYGNKTPSIEDLIKIAGVLRVSIDYLLDISQRKRISPEDELLIQTINDRERNLLDAFRQLDRDNQDIIMGETKKVLKEQRYSYSFAEDKAMAQKNGTDNLGKSYPSSGTEGKIS